MIVRRTGGLLSHGDFEYVTLAVGFGTCEQAQQSAREIKMYLDEHWHVDRLLSTPHSDFGCVIFVREISSDSKSNSLKDSFTFKGEKLDG